MDWLWYPYIPFGKATIIQGDPGEGKTTLALNIAATLSRGERLPTELEHTYTYDSITSIYQTAEDGLADTIKPRLTAANADCSRICTIIEGNAALHFCDSRLEETISSTGAKLLIMDPIQAYLGANVDIHRANEIRPVMSRLEAIAEKYRCAVVLYEDVVQIGTKDDTGIGTADAEIASACLDEYMQGFQKRNPNFIVFNGVKHMDEATPHLHIDYFPIGHYKHGIPIQNGLAQALKEMGYGGGPNAISRWRESERKILKEICLAHGLEVAEEEPARLFNES